jgi:succinate dehydrogenase / fumarate reductase flavoprotein subunit
MELKSKCPTGPIETRWDKYRFDLKLVNPANKRKFSVIVGSGPAGLGIGDTGELGYNVKCFCFQDTRAAPTALRRRVASTRQRLPE